MQYINIKLDRHEEKCVVTRAKLNGFIPWPSRGDLQSGFEAKKPFVIRGLTLRFSLNASPRCIPLSVKFRVTRVVSFSCPQYNRFMDGRRGSRGLCKLKRGIYIKTCQAFDLKIESEKKYSFGARK